MDTEEKVFVKTPFGKFLSFCTNLIDGPITWFRESVVEPNRQEHYWYHQKFRRVPTVDQCYTDDIVCIYEAEQQFKRDRIVDANILHILQKRYENCCVDNSQEQELCHDIYLYWKNAQDNYFMKYGELGIKSGAISCYLKQKHRLAWERRHGPIGSGKKPPKESKRPINEGDTD